MSRGRYGTILISALILTTLHHTEASKWKAQSGSIDDKKVAEKVYASDIDCKDLPTGAPVSKGVGNKQPTRAVELATDGPTHKATEVTKEPPAVTASGDLNTQPLDVNEEVTAPNVERGNENFPGLIQTSDDEKIQEKTVYLPTEAPDEINGTPPPIISGMGQLQPALLISLLICIPSIVVPNGTMGLWTEDNHQNESMVDNGEATYTVNGERRTKEVAGIVVDFAAPGDHDTVPDMCKDLESIGALDLPKIADHVENAYSEMLNARGEANKIKRAKQLLPLLDCFIDAMRIVQRNVEEIRQELLNFSVNSGPNKERDQKNEELMGIVSGMDCYIVGAQRQKKAVKWMLAIVQTNNGFIEDNEARNLDEQMWKPIGPPKLRHAFTVVYYDAVCIFPM